MNYGEIENRFEVPSGLYFHRYLPAFVLKRQILYFLYKRRVIETISIDYFLLQLLL